MSLAATLSLAFALSAGHQELVLAPADVPPSVLLPANLPIPLTVEKPVSSKTASVGDPVFLVVSDDIRVDDRIVIPRGTPARGRVTDVRATGAFGRSGKLEIALTTILVPGFEVPVAGVVGERGSGGTAATIGTAALAGPFAVLVTGKSAKLSIGTPATATTLKSLALVSKSMLEVRQQIRLAIAEEATKVARTAWARCAQTNADKWLNTNEAARQVAAMAVDACPDARANARQAIKTELSLKGAGLATDEGLQVTADAIASQLAPYVLDRRARR